MPMKFGAVERARDPPQVGVHDGFLLKDAEVLVRRVVRGLGFVLGEAIGLHSGRAADSTARDDVVLDSRGQLYFAV